MQISKWHSVILLLLVEFAKGGPTRSRMFIRFGAKTQARFMPRRQILSQVTETNGFKAPKIKGSPHKSFGRKDFMFIF